MNKKVKENNILLYEPYPDLLEEDIMMDIFNYYLYSKITNKIFYIQWKGNPLKNKLKNNFEEDISVTLNIKFEKDNEMTESLLCKNELPLGSIYLNSKEKISYLFKNRYFMNELKLYSFKEIYQFIFYENLNKKEKDKQILCVYKKEMNIKDYIKEIEKREYSKILLFNIEEYIRIKLKEYFKDKIEYENDILEIFTCQQYILDFELKEFFNFIKEKRVDIKESIFC